MNKDLDGAGLKGFYSYKNTFGDDNVWLEIPKHGMKQEGATPQFSAQLILLEGITLLTCCSEYSHLRGQF